MALFLMEPGDFVSDIRTMKEPELHGQLAWFVSWFKSTGFKSPADFSAYLEEKIKKSEEKHSEQSLDTDASQELHNKLKAELDSKQQVVATLVAELEGYVGDVGDDQPVLDPLSTQGKSQVQLKMDELEAARDEVRAAKRAYEESGDDFNCYFLINHVQMNETEMWREANMKVNRMMALEAEFEQRNKVAKMIAEHDAYLKKIECTWTPPQLPDFIHAEGISSSQEYPCQFVPNPAMAQDPFW